MTQSCAPNEVGEESGQPPVLDVEIVIPLHNEVDAIDHLAANLALLDRGANRRSIRLGVLFVDDGSTDGTLERLNGLAQARPDTRVFSQFPCRGVGSAMRLGFVKSRGEAVVCYDADCTYPVEDIFRLVEGLRDADIVSASPVLVPGAMDGVPWIRRVWTRLAVAAYRVALYPRSTRISLFTCAFRAYRQRVIHGILPSGNGFSAAAEILCRALLIGLTIREVASPLSNRLFGHSKMRTWKAVRGHLAVIARVGRIRLCGVRGMRIAHGTPEPTGSILRQEILSSTDSNSRLSFDRGELTVLEWNRRLNREHSQDQLLHHGNPVVKWLEARRRRVLNRCVLEALPKTGEPVVADVGCGTAILDAIPRRVRLLHVDIDPDLLGFLARSSWSSDRGDLRGIASDIAELPFADRSVDVVVASAVLEHVPDPDAVLAELIRVLRPGGGLVLSVPYDRVVLALKSAVLRLGLRRFYRGIHLGLAPGHLHVFRNRALRRKLQVHGGLECYFYDAFCFCIFARVRKDSEAR